MSEVRDNSWLHRFAVLTAAATFLLLGAGGLVTSHGVGMAVPDWPNTFGYNMFAFPFSQWIGGIFYEHSHRLIASGVGMLTLALAVWLWALEMRGRRRWIGITIMVFVVGLMGVRQMPVYITLASIAPAVIAIGLLNFWQRRDQLCWLGVAALAAVILQGVLGGLRVVWIQDQIGIFHATLAQLFFALVCAIALFASRWWRNLVRKPMTASAPETSAPLQGLFIVSTALILFQLVLGATMRHQHAGLAIPDFPLAYGKLWPATDAAAIVHYNAQRMEATALNPITAFQVLLQMVHRLVAVAILAVILFCAWKALRKFGWRNPMSKVACGWAVLILAQAGLGIATILSNKAADIATAHVLAGALSLAMGTTLCILSSRNLEPERGSALSESAIRVSDGSSLVAGTAAVP